MDFDGAIRKHAEWKFKFHDALYRETSLDAASISPDNQCEVGKWLHGEAASQFGGLPAYAKCVQAHANFHREAGKVAVAINQKRKDDVGRMLTAGSPFSEASRVVSVALVELKNAAH